MKFETKPFKECLQSMAPAINDRTIVPITENVKVKTKGNMVIMYATSLAISIEKEYKDDIDNGENEFLVNYKRLSEYIKMINEPTITVEVSSTDRSVKITSGKAKATIEGEDPKDFPDMPISKGEKFEIKRDFIDDVIHKAMPFRSSIEYVNPQGGTFWICEKGKMTVFATNGHQVSEVGGNEVESKKDFSIVVSGDFKNVDSIFKEDHTLRMSVDSERYSIFSEDTTFTGQIIDGNFPPCGAAMDEMDKWESSEAEVDRNELISEIKKAMIFGNSQSKQISIIFKKNEMGIKTTDIDYGTAYDNFVQCSYEGKEVEIGINGTYALTALGSASEETVKLQNFGDPMKPILLIADNHRIRTQPMQLRSAVV